MDQWEHKVWTYDYLEPDFKENVANLVDLVFNDKYGLYLGAELNGFAFVATDFPDWKWEVLELFNPAWDYPIPKDEIVDKLIKLATHLETKVVEKFQRFMDNLKDECWKLLEKDDV